MTIPCDLIKNYGWGTSFATFTMFRIVFWLVWLSCLIIYDFSAPHRLPPKRVTLTDPHVKDAARGGSVNEGRMVKTPTSSYSHTRDGRDPIDRSLELWRKKTTKILLPQKWVKKGLFFNCAGGLLTREEWWRLLPAHIATHRSRGWAEPKTCGYHLCFGYHLWFLSARGILLTREEWWRLLPAHIVTHRSRGWAEPKRCGYHLWFLSAQGVLVNEGRMVIGEDSYEHI